MLAPDDEMEMAREPASTRARHGDDRGRDTHAAFGPAVDPCGRATATSLLAVAGPIPMPAPAWFRTPASWRTAAAAARSTAGCGVRLAGVLGVVRGRGGWLRARAGCAREGARSFSGIMRPTTW